MRRQEEEQLGRQQRQVLPSGGASKLPSLEGSSGRRYPVVERAATHAPSCLDGNQGAARQRLGVVDARLQRSHLHQKAVRLGETS